MQGNVFTSLEREIFAANGVKYCHELSSTSTRELQKVLHGAGYYRGVVDGLYGIKTLTALKQFKTEAYLNRPTEIGTSTLAALRNLANKAKVSEQSVRISPTGVPTLLSRPVLDPQIGTHTGKTMVLPGGVRIHEKELIVPGIPLTWGEMTKGLQRKPETTQIVKNIIYMARKFGSIRQAIGQPLKVTSGYRPPHLKIGATRSQHRKARAFDLTTLDIRDIYRLWSVCVKSDAIGLGRGQRLGFVHVDYRLNSRRIIFNY